MLCVCYILLPRITTEATRVTYHTYCGIFSIFIWPRHIGLLNDALAFQRIPLTPVQHASTLCVNYSERSTGPFAALLYRVQSTCLKSLKSPYNMNGLVNCSNSLFLSFYGLAHWNICYTSTYLPDVSFARKIQDKKPWGLCLYSKALRLEKWINIAQERKAIGAISWQNRKLHGDTIKRSHLFLIPLV